MATLGKIVYLSATDYATLVSTGTVTVDGVTIAYSANDLYITPTEEVPSAYTSNPAALGASADPGSSGSWARGDHVHPKPSAADIGAQVPVSSTAVSSAGVISFKDANANVLFTVQLPLYNGGVT